jgi:hypothetical protein
LQHPLLQSSLARCEGAREGSLSFEDLVLRAAQGDRRALGAIAIAFGPKLLKEAELCLRGEFVAEDVLQDF